MIFGKIFLVIIEGLCSKTIQTSCNKIIEIVNENQLTRLCVVKKTNKTFLSLV